MTKYQLIDRFGGIPLLAKKLGISRHAIYQWKEVVPAEQAIKIEQITGGEITAKELRPDLIEQVTTAA